MTQSLTDEASRVRWESARVIGTIAKHFTNDLEEPINKLLVNAESKEIVVRWAAAHALVQILLLKTKHNEYLVSKIHYLIELEVDQAILKKYTAALKKI
jgi:hypothetical protein